MTRLSTTLIAALLIPTLAQADDRLWGVWQDIGPVDGATVIWTFSEDGSFSMSGPDLGEEDSEDIFDFEHMFGAILDNLEMSLDDLKELGFEPPVIEKVAFVGRWVAQDDSIKVWWSRFNAHLYVEGQPLAMDVFMVEVLTQIASLPIDEKRVNRVNLFIAAIPVAFEDLEKEEEELFIEARYYFLDDGQLVITSSEGGPLTLSRQAATAVQDASWGQIKARWP